MSFLGYALCALSWHCTGLYLLTTATSSSISVDPCPRNKLHNNRIAICTRQPEFDCLQETTLYEPLIQHRSRTTQKINISVYSEWYETGPRGLICVVSRLIVSARRRLCYLTSAVLAFPAGPTQPDRGAICKVTEKDHHQFLQV